ncbi:MAG: NAD-dependent succinate-semialdehyde dehydrogenase [Bacteroidota bacterium]
MTINSVNPFNGEIIKSYTVHTDEQVYEMINQSHKAWLNWRNTSFAERGACLKRVAQVLRRRRNELAELMALEMGKNLRGGLAEIDKCADSCEYFANNAEAALKEELIKTDAAKSYVTFQPIGVILAIMPWNFPFWQVFRFLGPALMVGNCSVLKHASNVFGCAVEIENILKEAGFPEHVFQTLLIGSSNVEAVIEHPLVQAVTLTGSVAAGRKVAQKAGSLIKKSVLELGGSDPYIILEDADLELAAETCTNSRLINSGQSCISAKRMIVVEEVANQFLELFTKKMAAKVMGDPLDAGSDLGPQARIDLRNELHKQVTESIKKGAKCILGGIVPEGNNALYPPTILTHVKKGMPAYDEELFGPAAAVIVAKDEEDAITIANDSEFGLGAAIFTKDVSRGERIAADRLEAGACFVNSSVKSDASLPFGGIKQSGYGRELGVYGFKELVNIKTVYVK